MGAGGSESDTDNTGREAEVREERRRYAGFEDGGRGPRPRKCRETSEIEKGKEINFPLGQGCQTHFHGCHSSLAVVFKGPNVILGLYTCNCSLTAKRVAG